MKSKKIIIPAIIFVMLLILTILFLIMLFKHISLPSTKAIQENGTIQLCFSQQENCSAVIIEMIGKSSSIKTALYDLDNQALIDALKKKNADVLIDEDNYFGSWQKITGTGLMHNKFWILYNISDKDYVLTGSLNPTYNDLYKNDNNLIIIDSSKYLKSNYEAEFSELKNQQKDAPTKHQIINISGIIVENYFCPDDDCENKVLAALRSAKKSVYFMTFSFTSDPIGDFLIANKDKLDIKGVFDELQVSSQKQYTEYFKMLTNKMNVRIDGNTAKLHHKVFIIDERIVITGSYNPTSAGTSKNDENILIIHDEEIAKKYINEFHRIWNLTDN